MSLFIRPWCHFLQFFIKGYVGFPQLVKSPLHFVFLPMWSPQTLCRMYILKVSTYCKNVVLPLEGKLPAVQHKGDGGEGWYFVAADHVFSAYDRRGSNLLIQLLDFFWWAGNEGGSGVGDSLAAAGTVALATHINPGGDRYYYSITCLVRPPLAILLWSYKAGSPWWQVPLYWKYFCQDCLEGCIRTASPLRTLSIGLVGHFVQTWPDSKCSHTVQYLRL